MRNLSNSKTDTIEKKENNNISTNESNIIAKFSSTTAEENAVYYGRTDDQKCVKL